MAQEDYMNISWSQSKLRSEEQRLERQVISLSSTESLEWLLDKLLCAYDF